MKTLKLILGFFTALNISIATQTADILLSDLPGCAQNCLQSAILGASSYYRCDEGDTECICNSPIFVGYTAECFGESRYSDCCKQLSKEEKEQAWSYVDEVLCRGVYELPIHSSNTAFTTSHISEDASSYANNVEDDRTELKARFYPPIPDALDSAASSTDVEHFFGAAAASTSSITSSQGGSESSPTSASSSESEASSSAGASASSSSTTSEKTTTTSKKTKSSSHTAASVTSHTSTTTNSHSHTSLSAAASSTSSNASSSSPSSSTTATNSTSQQLTTSSTSQSISLTTAVIVENTTVFYTPSSQPTDGSASSGGGFVQGSPTRTSEVAKSGMKIVIRASVYGTALAVMLLPLLM